MRYTTEEVTKAISRCLTQTIVISEPLFKALGSLDTALFVSRLLWNSENNDKVKDKDGWFFFTSEQWAELGIQKKRKLTIQEDLIKLGLIEIKRMEVPAKNFYRLDKDKIIGLLLGTLEIEQPKDDVEPIQLDGAQGAQLDGALSNQLDGAQGAQHSIKLKKELKREEQLSLAVDLTLSELDRTGSYQVSKRQFIKVLGCTEAQAKKFEKQLKDIKDIEKRKEFLIELIANGSAKPANTAFKSKPEILPDVKLPLPEMNNLETLAGYYANFTGRPIEISKQHIHDFIKLRREYKFPDIEYVVRNCLKAAKEKPYYSRSFDQILKLNIVQLFISDPYLKIVEDQ